MKKIEKNRTFLPCLAAALAAALALAAGASPAMAGTQAAPEPLHWKADAGTTVFLVQDDRVPVVTLRLRFPAGEWSEWVRENHASEAFQIQLYDTAGRLRRRADALGIRPGLHASARRMELGVSFLREDLDGVMNLVREILTNREFDRRELRRWRKAKQLEWKARQTYPYFRLQQSVREMLFRPGDPRRLDFEKPLRLSTDVEALAAARDVLLRLPGRQIGFAGSIDRTTAEKAIEGLLPAPLDEPPSGLDPAFLPPADPARLPREISVPMRRLTQVYFSLTRLGLTLGDPDYLAFQVADHILGGNFYSRLSTALRHEKGDTYGAGTRGGGALVPEPYGLVTFTRAPNAASTQATLRGVLETFHEKGITEPERKLAAGYLLGRRWTRHAAPDTILAEVMWEQRYGLPRGYRDTLAEQAAAIPLEEINALIERFYDPKGFSMLRVQPR